MSPLPGSVIFVNIVTTHSASAEKVTDATKKSEPQIIQRVNFSQGDISPSRFSCCAFHICSCDICHDKYK